MLYLPTVLTLARPGLGRHRIRLAGTAATLAAIVLAACSGDDGSAIAVDVQGDGTGQDTTIPLGAPTVTISEPVEDSVFTYGEAVGLLATAAHPSEALDALSAEWRRDAELRPLWTGHPNAAGRLVLDVDALPVGPHVITVTVTDADGETASASVSVRVNAPPSAPGVAITPTGPTTLDALNASVTTDAVDADGDPVSYRYAWLKDGAPVDNATATVPAASTSRGETWRALVYASDGRVEGPAGSAEVTIANAAPSCASVSVSPAVADTGADFTCACADRQDPDAGDPIADECHFTVDGEPIGGDDGACTLLAADTDHGMEITCTLTPSDGDAAGAPVDSAPFSVLDSAPTTPEVSLAPAAGDATTSFTCTVATPSVDIDGDPITYAVRWLVGGTEVAGVAATTAIAGALTRADGTSARHGDSVQCSMTASDGSLSSQPGLSGAVVLDDAPPTLDTVVVHVVGGTAAVAGATLACEPSDAIDPDGDPLTFTVTWTVGGAVVTGETGTTLSSDHFARGDVVSCAVVASDGAASTSPVESKNSITIQNSLPQVAAAYVTPAEVSRGGTLSCSYDGWADADGDAPEVAVAWLVVTEDASTTPIVGATGDTLDAASLTVGAHVACAVTPKNGDQLGETVMSAPATVINTAPSLGGATLGPVDATVATTLSCTPEGFTDVDGDDEGERYAWTKNGALIEGATAATLSGAFVKGDHVRCQATPFDGLATGDAVTSNEVVIGNTLPTLASLSLTPATPAVCATPTCSAGAVTDADTADSLSIVFQWKKNGVQITGAGAATLTGQTLAPGDTLQCSGRPYDGTVGADGQAVYGAERVSEVVTVDNAPPSVASVALLPAGAGVGTELTCTPAGWSDDCTTGAAYSWRWYVDGALVDGATGATLGTAELARGAQIRCQATPNDGLTDGPSVDSPAVTLGPGEAVAPVVAVVAPSGAEGDVSCEITTAEQWFDAPSYTYYWSKNGGEEAEGAATMAAADVGDCDVLTCRVQVTDARSSLSSNTATLQLAVGPDCEDGNDCTSHVCDPAGGCAAPVPEDAVACRADDACKPTGVCVAGSCEADGNICVEEPVNIAAAGEPRVVGTLDGSYVVQWTPGATAATHFRETDPSDSRRNEEVVPLAGTALSGGAHPLVAPVATSDGGFAVAEIGGGKLLDYNSWYGTRADAVFNLHVYGADGAETATHLALYAATAPCSPYCGYWPSGATFCGGCTSEIRDILAQPLELSSGLGVVVSAIARVNVPVPYGGHDSFTPAPIAWVPATGGNAGTATTLVEANRLNAAPRRVAVTALPAGSDTIGVLWVGPGDAELRVQRFVNGADGVTAGDEKLVRTGEGTITTPRIASFYDGSFIVGWTEASTSNGTEAYVQRFDSSGSPTGALIRVNDVTTGNQALGGIDTFFDFGFVAVYDDSRADGPTDSGVVARLFSPSGTPGAPIVVNTTQAGVQHLGTVATLADDEWLVAWVDTPTSGIMTRRFDREGFPLPGVREVQPAENTNGDQARIDGAASKQGTVLLAWDTALFPGQDTEIAARLFSADGLPLTQETIVNATTADAQRTPVVAGGDGRFVVAWESLGEDGSGYGIYARRLNGEGQPLGDAFRVNDTTANNQLHPAIAMRADGSFLIAWDGFVSPTQRTETYAKAYDASGNVIIAETQLNTVTAAEQEQPDVAVNPLTNQWLVAWQSKNQVAADSGFDLFARTVAPGATAAAPTLGSERQLNTTTTGDQKSVSIGVSPTGYLAACWEDGAPDVTCQTFTASSMIVKTPEFPVATLAAGAQQHVVLAHGSDGKLVVAWESDGVDRDGKGIQLRHFSAQGPASGMRLLVNRFMPGDETRPRLIPLAGGRLFVAWQSSAQDGAGAGVYFRSLWTP